MDPADKLPVPKAEVLDDVRLRHPARDADVLVSVGGQDVGSTSLEIPRGGEGDGC